MSALSLPARAAALPRAALLRLVLKLDAAVTGANGLAYLAAAGPLEDLLGVEAAALRGIGTVLVLFAAAVWFASTRAEPPRAAVLAHHGRHGLDRAAGDRGGRVRGYADAGPAAALRPARFRPNSPAISS